MSREETINQLKTHFKPDRLANVDKDFLDFELELAGQDTLDLTLKAAEHQLVLPNPHNSVLLYVAGLTNDFDTVKGRSNTVGGSPPDCN